jgi:hypothetical protein
MFRPAIEWSFGARGMPAMRSLLGAAETTQWPRLAGCAIVE